VQIPRDCVEVCVQIPRDSLCVCAKPVRDNTNISDCATTAVSSHTTLTFLLGF